MAGIDKTYIKKWEDYKAIFEWCDKQETQETCDGFKWNIIEWFPLDDDCNPYTKEMFLEYTKNETREIVLWNTPTFVDVFLIRNCTIPVIVERLKVQYGDEYELIRDRKSEYDTYTRETPLVDCYRHPRIDTCKKDSFFEIRIEDFSYSEKHGKWYHLHELPWEEFNEYSSNGNLSNRKLTRLLKKWGLPQGLEVTTTSYPSWTRNKFKTR